MRCNFIVSLSVGGDTQSQPSLGQTDTDGGSIGNTESQSSALQTLPGSEAQTSTPASPTLHAVQQMESAVSTGTNQSAASQPVRDGEETKYQSPHKQSRSFQMLEQGLRMSEAGQGLFACMFEHDHFTVAKIALVLTGLYFLYFYI